MSGYPIAAVRGCRIAIHLLYGAFQALHYPRLDRTRQQRMLKAWSRELLSILNIRIRISGHQRPGAAVGCMMVANHVSWLDIFALNAIQPAHFIAKAEVRAWPLIGWLCERSGTIFVDRAMRRDTAEVNRRATSLLRRGECIGLFPEGTTTDGSRVGHFHPALMQPMIDADVMLCPVALRYLDADGKPSTVPAFTGDITLARSVWRILRCRRLEVSVEFTPALAASGSNRRILARTAQEAIRNSLQIVPWGPAEPRLRPEPGPAAAIPPLSTQTA